MTGTHYEVLGVPQDASEKDIVHAYRVLMRTWHPDIAGPAGAEKTATINHAYDVLHDPAARRDYDRSLAPAPKAQPDSRAEPEPPTRQQPYEPQPVNDEPELNTVMAKRGRHLGAVFGGGAVAVAGSLSMLGAFGSGGISVLVMAASLVGVVATLLFPRSPLWVRLLAFTGPAAFVAALIWPRLSYEVTPVFWAGAVTAGAAAWALRVAANRLKAHRDAVREAQEWVQIRHYLFQGYTILWVSAADNFAHNQCNILGSDFDDNEYSLILWGSAVPGNWIAVNSANKIVFATAGTSPSHWLKLTGTEM